MAKLEEGTRQILREMIPPVGTRADNPVDPGPVVELDPGIHGRIIKVLADDPNVDMVLVISNKRPGACESIVEAVKNTPKPVAATLLTLPELSGKEYDLMSQSGVATFGEAKRAIFALAKMCDYAEFRKSRNDKK
jgi:acyl-CoA synthetase (NDP forming)